MKKLNRKGFTIIELVIVIAVIAILAAVMVPTFSSIVTKAKMSAAEQEAMSYFKEIYAIDWSDGKLDGKDDGETIEIEGITIRDTVGELTNDEVSKLTKYIVYKIDDTKILFKFIEKDGYTVEYSWDANDYKWQEPKETKTKEPNAFAQKSSNSGD